MVDGTGGIFSHGGSGGRDGAVWAESSHRVNRVGGEIFAKTAKTPPLQSGVVGISMRDAARHIATNARPNAALRINRPKRSLRQP